MSANVQVARWVDWGVVAALALAGLLHPTPGPFYVSLGIGFAVLAGAVLGGAGATEWVCRRIGTRIQGPRRKPAPIGAEAFETARAMFVAACLLAWPLTSYRAGEPTGLFWSFDEVDIRPSVIIAQTFVGVVVMDAWLYWKHRMLHARWLFPYHSSHHRFRDPTAFAGFAVQPLEALLTFWPVVLWGFPAVAHYGPLYLALVIGFVILNFYLHCGVTFAWIERVVPRTLLNTSAHHNVHHSHANVNFGEASVLWDRLCGTDQAGKSAGPRRPGEAGSGSLVAGR